MLSLLLNNLSKPVVISEFRRPSILRFLTITSAFGAVWGLMEIHLFLYLNKLGISKQEIGVSQSAATLSSEFDIFKIAIHNIDSN